MRALRQNDYDAVLGVSPVELRARFTGRADILRYELPEIQTFSFRSIQASRGSEGGGYHVVFGFEPTWRKQTNRMVLHLREEAGQFVVTFSDPPGI